MKRLLSILVAVGLWLSAVPALAESDVHVLVQRLKTGEDFRVRVAAALELGRSKTGLSREPLEAALDDEMRRCVPRRLQRSGRWAMRARSRR